MRVQQLNIRTWFQYMENVARSNTALLHVGDNDCHFSRGDPEILLGMVNMRLKSPALVVDVYDDEGIDKASNNLLIRRMVAFTVLKKYKKGDLEDQLDAEYDCETIALKIIARMRHDRLDPRIRAFADVEIDNRSGLVITETLSGDWAGFRMQIPVINPDDRMTFNSADWTDSNEVPILFDLTGLSCANLNHPTLGLTTAQRTNCLHVTIYEPDGSTVNSYVAAGGSFIIPASTDMPYIKAIYADLSAASADVTTVPAADQAIKIANTGRMYPGDGTSTASDLITGALFYLPATENEKGLNVVAQGQNKGLELVDPT